MELREMLLEYKKLTEMFIKFMEKDEYELKGEEVLNKRQILLDELKSMSFDKNELISISKELNLVALEETAFIVIKTERNKIKEEILSLKKQHNAVKTYGVGFKNINFINKEV